MLAEQPQSGVHRRDLTDSCLAVPLFEDEQPVVMCIRHVDRRVNLCKFFCDNLVVSLNCIMTLRQHSAVRQAFKSSAEIMFKLIRLNSQVVMNLCLQ